MMVQLLLKKAKLLREVHKEVKGLKDEFETIQCLLKYADKKVGERGLEG